MRCGIVLIAVIVNVDVAVRTAVAAVTANSIVVIAAATVGHDCGSESLRGRDWRADRTAVAIVAEAMFLRDR